MQQICKFTVVFLLVILTCLSPTVQPFLFSTLPTVDTSTIVVEWIRKGEWQLSAKVQWAIPTGFTDDMVFLVRMPQIPSYCSVNSSIPVRSDDEKMECDTGIFGFEEKTTDTSAKNNYTTLNALEYGLTYTLQIAVKDAVNDTSRPACFDVEAPDCYTLTKSRDFCQDICTPLCSPPIEVAVLEVILKDRISETANVTVTWLRPVQHSNNIWGYTVSFMNLQTTYNEISTDMRETSANDELAPLVVTVAEVKVNVSYEINVQVYAENLHGNGGIMHGPRTSLDWFKVNGDLTFSTANDHEPRRVTIIESTTAVDSTMTATPSTTNSPSTIKQTSLSNTVIPMSVILLLLLAASVQCVFA